MPLYITNPGLEGINAGNKYTEQAINNVVGSQETLAQDQRKEQAERNRALLAIQRERELIGRGINPITGGNLLPGQQFGGQSYGEGIVEAIGKQYITDAGRIPGVDPNKPQSQIPNQRNIIMPGAIIPQPGGWADQYKTAQTTPQGAPIYRVDPNTGQQMIDPKTGKPVPATTPWYTPEFFYGR